jgi:hypothetical protein
MWGFLLFCHARTSYKRLCFKSKLKRQFGKYFKHFFFFFFLKEGISNIISWPVFQMTFSSVLTSKELNNSIVWKKDLNMIKDLNHVFPRKEY